MSLSLLCVLASFRNTWVSRTRVNKQINVQVVTRDLLFLSREIFWFFYTTFFLECTFSVKFFCGVYLINKFHVSPLFCHYSVQTNLFLYSLLFCRLWASVIFVNIPRLQSIVHEFQLFLKTDATRNWTIKETAWRVSCYTCSIFLMQSFNRFVR